MLRYIDAIAGHGGLDKETLAAIDAHLLECPECLNEAAELNRIGAAADSAEPVHLSLNSPQPGQAAVFPNAYARFVSAVPVRGGEKSGGAEIYRLDNPVCEIRITRKAEGSYKIALVFGERFTEYVELRSPGAPAPLFLKKPDSRETEIRSVAPGKYGLALGKTILYIELRA